MRGTNAVPLGWGRYTQRRIRACASHSPRSASPPASRWRRLRPNPKKSNRATLSTALAALCCLMTIRGNFSRRAGPARSPPAAAARRRQVLKGSLRPACRLRPTVRQRASLIRSKATQNPKPAGVNRRAPSFFLSSIDRLYHVGNNWQRAPRVPEQGLRGSL